MKKLSLVLCFALMLVLIFAFNAFAATKNDIATDARFEQNGSSSDLLDLSKVIDGEYNTASSCGNAGENWVNYRFYYDEGTAVSKVFVVVNGTGTLSNGKVYETVSQHNYEFYIRLYAKDGKTTYFNQKYKAVDNATQYTDAEGNVLYTYVEVEFEKPYFNIYQVEVAVVNNKNADVGLWEVEIYDYMCEENDTHYPTKDDANCTTASTCGVCGAELVPAMLHEFDDETNLCKNEGCGVFFIPGCFDDYELGDKNMMESWYGDSEVKDEQGNYLGGYAGGGNNSFDGIFNNNLTNDGWGGGAAPRYNGDYNMTFFFKQSHLIRNTTIYYKAHNLGGGFDIELSNDGGVTWEKVGEFRADQEQVNVITPVEIQINMGLGQMANAYRFIWRGGYTTFQVSVVEIDITGSTPLDCSWNDGIVTTPATCGTDGVKTFTCTSCGDKYTETIAATGLHTYDEGVVTKPATDTEDGIMTYTCTVCPAYYEEAITAIKHNYVATVTPPTCTAKGYTTYTCDGTCGVEGCDKSYVDQQSYVAEIPHSYDEEVTIKATALNQGLLTYTCSACGDSYTRTTPKLEWGDNTSVIGPSNIVKYEPIYKTADGLAPKNADPAKLFDGVINSTWTQNNGDGWFGPSGSTLLITLDKEYYVISAKYQAWSNWNSGTIEFLNVNGEKVKSYSKGDIQTTNGTDWYTADSLANAVGVKYIKITINSAKGDWGQCLAFQELEITVHNHDQEGEAENVKEATCTTPGSYDATCSVCGLAFHVETPALGHNYIPGATTEDGNVEYTCTNGCGEDFVANNSAVNGSYYNGTGDSIVFLDGVATINGVEHYYIYNVNTCMINIEDADYLNFQVIEGKIYYKSTGVALHKHNGETYIVEDGKVICNICGASNMVLDGEYLMDSINVVFADGKVTIDGTAYDYAYNVSTGMIDVAADVYFQVSDGKIYFKGATVLHQHTADVYVEEAQEDGSVKYVCQFCGAYYVIDNSAINGAYFLGDDKVEFVNGVVTGPFGTANYTYNVTTGMIDTDVDGINFQVVDGVIYFKKNSQLHQHIGNFYTEIPQEDGTLILQCNFCSYTETINNVAIEGTYYNDTGDAITFADGKVIFLGEEFDYTYNQSTGMIDVIDPPFAGLHFQVVGGKLFYNSTTELHKHESLEFSGYVDGKAPTCAQGATAIYICQFCGEIEVEVEATGEHSYFAACDKICQVCGEETNPDATHTIVHVEAKAGTDCQTFDGNIEYWYCEVCGYAWADEALTLVTNRMSIPTNGAHSYFAACDKICQVCGEETNPDATHNIVHVEAKAGTDCQTFDGNVEYWYCSDCGSAWLNEELTLVTNLMSVKVAGAHGAYIEETADATCDAPGSVTKICAVCMSVISTETIEATGHNYVAGEPVLPSCGNDGYTPYTCTNCGNVDKRDVVEAPEHDWFFTGYDPENMPTCDREGIANYVCLNCEETKTETALHRLTYFASYVEGQEPTCTEYGYAVYECLWCSESETRKVAPAHNYEVTDSVAATCTEDGSQTFVCAACGDTYTEVVPARGHNKKWQYDSTTATCTEAGVEIYGCYNCSELIEVEVDAYGHTWNIDNDSINLEAHTVNRVCSTCEATEAISSLGMKADPYTFAVPGSVTVNASEAYTFYLIQLPEGMSEGYLTLSFNTENSFTYLLDANDIYASQYGSICEIQSDGKYLLGVSTNYGEEEITVTATFEAATIPSAGEVPEKAITIEDTNTAYVGTGKVWYKFADLMPGTVTFVIDVDATIKYGIFGWGETVTEDALITYTGAFENTDYNTYYICVESAEPFEFVVNLEEPVGSRNNPLELVVGDNTIATAGGWSTYYAIFEATTAGTITFTYDAETYNNVVIYMGTNPYNVRTFVMSGEPIELEAGTYYLAIKTSDWSAVTFNLAVEFEAAQGPEIPEPDDEIGDKIGSIDVETTDTYGFFDEYTYVAENAGKYTFFVPAGLGFYSKVKYDAYSPAEVDFYENNNGDWVTIELAKGESYTFLVGSLTKDEWTIDVYYLAPAHTCDFTIPTKRVESTCTTQGYVIYACSCGETKKEDLPLADHTEKVIPAIPGELRNPGMTSGVECSVCGETLVAPVQASGDFRIGATSLNLGENVSIIYKAAVPAGYENVYMVFEMTVLEDGVEVVKTFKVEEYEIGADGRYWFTFSGIRLQYMADLVTATVYAEQDGIVSANSYSNYSVKSYITGQLAKATNSAELKTMLSDLLILGAKTQIYADYRADNLMTADVDASILTPSTYAGVPSGEFVQKMIVNDEETRKIADWKSVSLTFKDAMSLQFKLAIDPSKLEGIEIKVYVPVYDGITRVDTYTAEDFTYSASEDRYILFVDNIKASQYGQTVVGEIYYNGEQISRTVNYSVNSYIQKNQDNSNVALRDFLRAAYQYGLSVFDYAY